MADKMTSEPDKIMMCPICLETMTKPIIQCKKGHSMCGSCLTANTITICPTCRGPLSSTRNYQLEQLIEGVIKILKFPCDYSKKGCKFVLSQSEKEAHEAECKYRKFTCEGKKFANWRCDWSGDLTELHKHFTDYHNNHTWMQYRTEASMKINLQNNFLDVQIISFFNGQQYLYYKHKVDVQKKKAYWTFQFIGPKRQAKNYYYEFEVNKGPIQKFKVTQICENDNADANDIFEKEECVVMSFTSIKNFLNEDGELQIKFRIMTVKKSTS